MLKSYMGRTAARSRLVISAVVLVLYFSHRIPAQSTLDALLTRIESNNKTLQAERQRVDATAKSFQTGIWLYDPQVSYDFLKGFPSSAGNQNDLILTQAFDYPTVYTRRRRVADLKTRQLTFENNGLRQEILLEAKLAAIQLVFLNKRQSELNNRLSTAQQFLVDYRKKFDARDATALDLNKAQHQVINLQTELKLLEVEIGAQLVQLTGLNGGLPVEFTDTVYPAEMPLPAFDSLEQRLEIVSPALQYLEIQRQAGDAQLALTKALVLPKMEVGYHYQGILGQQFHGLHVGLNIPLWEHKNRVAQQQLQTTFYTGELEAQRTRQYYAVKAYYEKYQGLRRSLDEYRTSLETLNNMELLNRALEAGQITTLEYFVEQSLLYESRDRLLELEREVAKAAAELFRLEL